MTIPVLLLLLYFLTDYGRPAVFEPLHLGAFLLALFLVYLAKDMNRVSDLLKDGYFKLFLLLLAQMTLMGFLADNNYWAFWGFVGIATYFIYSIAFSLFLDTTRKITLVLSFYVFVSALTAVFRIFGGAAYFGGTGFISETNDYSMAMNVVIPIGFYLGVSCGGWKRLFFWICSVLLIVANVMTMSRGGFLGLLAVTILCWMGTKKKIASLFVLLLLSMIFLNLIPEQYKKEILSIGSEIENVQDNGQMDGIQFDHDLAQGGGTGRDRVELWKTAWRMFLDNPILGVGQENLSWKLGNYQFDESGKSFWARMVSGRAVHSIYFTVLPEFGIVGVAIWFSMIYNLYRKYKLISKDDDPRRSASADTNDIRGLKYCATGLAVGIVAYLVTGAFLSAFYYPHFWNLAGLFTAVFFTRRKLMGYTGEPRT